MMQVFLDVTLCDGMYGSYCFEGAMFLQNCVSHSSNDAASYSRRLNLQTYVFKNLFHALYKTECQ
jgi:hypothetical protein